MPMLMLSDLLTKGCGVKNPIAGDSKDNNNNKNEVRKAYQPKAGGKLNQA